MLVIDVRELKALNVAVERAERKPGIYNLRRLRTEIVAEIRHRCWGGISHEDSPAWNRLTSIREEVEKAIKDGWEEVDADGILLASADLEEEAHAVALEGLSERLEAEANMRERRCER